MNNAPPVKGLTDKCPMEERRDNAPLVLPDAEQLRRAVEIYLAHAYPAGPPQRVLPLVPPPGADPAEWLMSDAVERETEAAAGGGGPAAGGPDASDPAAVRSFVLRLGNAEYMHMKLRLSRPPRDGLFLFMVDCHDKFVVVPPDSPEYEAVEQLKRYNAELAAAIAGDWDRAGLPTEHNYLRARIAQTRRGHGGR